VFSCGNTIDVIVRVRRRSKSCDLTCTLDDVDDIVIGLEGICGVLLVSTYTR